MTASSTSGQPHVIVIGGGFGGIAAALRCRAMGAKVTLVERLERLGGRAQVFEVDGFKHDAGPTVITAPFLFNELFQLFNEDIKDHLQFVPLTPWYRFYFHDGRTFDYGQDMSSMRREIASFNPDDVDGYLELVSASKGIFDVGFSKLAHKPFTKFSTMIEQIPSLLALRADRTVSQLVAKHIKDPMLRRAFSIQPLLVGGNPFNTTAIYSLIHYLERKWGVFFCMGGTGALVDALEGLLQRQGVEIATGKDIRRIEVSSNKVTGVILDDGQRIQGEYVVCNADPPTVYKEMLDRGTAFERRLRRPLPEKLTKYSMGLYVLYFGTTREYPDVAHHTIWLGQRFKGLLKDIFDRGKLTEDFSLYVHRPTATDKSFAPSGCDSFYVLCPVPNLKSNLDWEIEGKNLRDGIVSALSRTILPDLEATITSDFWMDPTDFRDDYRSRHGAGFSIAPIFRQSAWFRYRNQDPRIRNLFFTGAGTHPGAGLPGVVSSAKVVETLLKESSEHHFS